MHEADVDYPQLDSQEDGRVGDLTNGIMDLLDNSDPNQAGTVEAKPDQPQEEVTEETPTEETETPDETQKYIIKHQGQDKEVTEQELFELAQKGFDYTKKTQELAAERDNLSPYVGLANTIKARPELAQKIADLIAGKQEAAHEATQQFDDPIEQLKYEIEQKASSVAEQKIQAALQPLQRMQVLNAVRSEVQRDPEYREIHQSIIDMVKSQPPSIQKTLYLQLDQDPQAYLEAFQHFKKQRGSTAEPTEAPKPVSRVTKAPILEAGGVSAPDSVQTKEKAERLTKMKAKALRSGDPKAISEWLGASGAIDHLY